MCRKNPPKAVTLNILDVAGNKQLTGAIFDQFAKDHPDIISSVTWETAGAPDMAGKVKAQQQAGNLKIDLVLTGTDGLAAGISESLFAPVAKDYKDRLGNMANYQEPAAAMQKLAQDQAVALVYYPSGPLLEYNPEKVPNPPTTAEELLSWAKEHPGRFGYARPANSGPGRTFLMGLPYILGDSDPKDPVNGWSKTWDYLKQLNQSISSYPTGTGVTMNNLKNGTWDMAITTTRVGHQPPRPGPGAGKLQDPDPQGLHLGYGRAVRGGSQGRLGGQDGGDPPGAAVRIDPGTAGQDVRHRLLLPGPGHQGRHR